MPRFTSSLTIPLETALGPGHSHPATGGGMRFLGAGTQGDNLVVWFDHDTEYPPVTRRVHVIQPVAQVPAGTEYVATVQVQTWDHRYFTLHVYADPMPEPEPPPPATGEKSVARNRAKKPARTSG